MSEKKRMKNEKVSAFAKNMKYKLQKSWDGFVAKYFRHAQLSCAFSEIMRNLIVHRVWKSFFKLIQFIDLFQEK